MSNSPASYPVITINTVNPDPTNAINAFLWCLIRARDLGMSPPTEHNLAEQLFRKSARIMFYSSMNGVTSLVMDDEAADDLADEDAFDFMVSVLKRRAQPKERRAKEAKKAVAQGIEARSDETPQAAQPEGREPGSQSECAQTPDRKQS